MIISPKRMELT